MSILPPKQLYSTKLWFSIFGSMLLVCIIWASHFVIEYGICIKNNIDIVWVNAVYIGCALGSLLAFLLSTRIDHHRAYLIHLSFYISAIILLLVTSNFYFQIIALFLVGFSNGGLMGHIFIHLIPVFPDPKYNGRSMGWGYTIMNLLILGEIWMMKSHRILLNIIILVIFLFFIYYTTLQGKKDYPESPQKSVKFQNFIQKKKNQPFILIAFFWGFFLTIPIYASYHLIINNPLVLNINFFNFMSIIFLTMMVGSLPVGILLDKIGRRKVLLLGLLILSLAFVLLIFPELYQIDDILFPVILGLGFTMVLPSHSLLMIEIPSRKELQDSISLGYFIMSIGMSAGALLGHIFRDIYIEDPIYISTLLLFFMLIVAIVIAEIEETLPNKAELEWKSSIQFISIMYRSGINIYSQKLNQEIQTNEEQNECLLGGALVAVSSILDEIAQKFQSLKVIKKEGFSILIEETDDLIFAVFTVKELKIIRKKMKIFVEDFQSFFKELIDLEITNTTSFLPTKRLVDKHFQFYW